MAHRVWVLAVAVLSCAAPPPPQVTVWAWEAPQDLRFLPPGVDVALFAADVQVRSEGVSVRKRVQPARLPEGLAPLAVVHLETHGRGFNATTRAQLIDALVERVDTFHARGLQLDFDARPSEYDDTRALLEGLRARLGGRALSMTGLASWCSGDAPWFRGAPVDEVVPQLFRLGPEAAAWRRRFDQGALARCGQSVGLSTDEVITRVPHARRVFLFHPGPWTHEAFTRALEALQ